VDDVGGAFEPEVSPAVQRGKSSSSIRAFVCKDCQREVEHLEAELETLVGSSNKARLKKVRAELKERREKATYNENWAKNLVERGGSRSDRCKDHRLKHRTNIQGIAVAYIDLETVGEVANRENPTGPLGGLGPLPAAHEIVEGTSYPLQEVKVGMTDAHVVKMIELLRDKRVLVLKAGTGTGKSTFAPYRLMDPPAESLENLAGDCPFAKITELGPIIVTEPRVQAAVGVANFVGGVMSGAGGVGPGYPVGYQVSGDRNHDEACELIYVTDGTMINWLREGRLSRIGTVIVDEAHERSTNIDFIMGYLNQELARYPHLRVIITSATFNTAFYQEYFGGPDVVNVMDVPAEKAFGYGMPLFANLDTPESGEDDVLDTWQDEALPLSHQQPRAEGDFIRKHWPDQDAPPFEKDDLLDKSEAGEREDVWDTTSKLLDLRYTGQVPMDQWRERMPDEMAKFVIRLAKGLDDQDVFGDILGFLPTRRTIEPVCAEIERALGRAYHGHVFPLISTLPKDQQRKALAKRRKGDPRKIVISTNLAETSLTVEGVRFVVDSGVIAQSEWDPELAQGGIPTKAHSQAGIKQRWGRVGRKGPGWVFPLYSKGQYLQLAQDTPPGSTRENLEALVMTAKMGGIDDVVNFPWPAAFQPTTTELDKTAVAARETFLVELSRADAALRSGGAVDPDGHPTSFGKELSRFSGLGSTASALAVMYADRLACVPEVVTILALLEGTRLVGQRGLLQDDYEWPDEWRLEASDRHRGLASLCEDDAELVVVIAAAWERADPAAAPWEPSELRKSWARKWWVNHEVLVDAATKRQEVLGALSPAMKEEVKRFLEPALINRARGAITRALASHLFERATTDTYRRVPTTSDAEDSPEAANADGDVDGAASAPVTPTVFGIEDDTVIKPDSERVIALRRREARLDSRVSNLVKGAPWALGSGRHATQPTGVVDAMRMVVAAARLAPAEPAKSRALQMLASWPVGQRMRLVLDGDDTLRVREVLETLAPFARPLDEVERGVSQDSRGRRRRPRPKRSTDDEDLVGTRSDSDGELALRVTAAGYRDENAEGDAAFADIDKNMETAAPCGECFPCLDGREEDCENPGDVQRAAGKRQDLVHAWLVTARSDHDVLTPRVVVEGNVDGSEGWYEVAGYQAVDDGLAVKLRPDWRFGRIGNPAQHVDVAAGHPIEVTIGPMLRHHGGPLRSFERTDGRGRFVVAEASNRRGDVQERRREIAISLDRGNSSLLSELTPGQSLIATVVPARAEGCYTITLLELLHQHWTKAEAGRGVEQHVIDPTRRNAARKAVYAAVVDQAVNDNGYATARLLHQDGVLGVRHRFDFSTHQPKARNDGQVDEAADEVGMLRPDLGLGDPLLVNVVRDQSRLDVSGLDLDVLEEVVAHSNRQLEVSGLPTDHEAPPKGPKKASGSKANTKNAAPAPRVMPVPDADADADADAPDEDSDEDERLAPPGAMLRPTSDRPLSRSAAEALCDLSDDPKWPNEVWSFWARSHHMTIHSQLPFIVGTAREPFEVRASVVIETGSPLEQQRRRVEAYARDHPLNSVVEATVVSLARHGAYVELEPGLEGLVPVREMAWVRTDHPGDLLSPGDRVMALITAMPTPPAKIELSLRALTPDPFASFKSAHGRGDVVSGTVRNATDSHVYVQLDDQVEGVIHLSQLAHERIESASEAVEVGTEITLSVLGFNEERRQVELSRKALLATPYESFKASHNIGDTVRAAVRNATKTHAYLDLDGGVTGAVFFRDLDYEKVDDASVHSPPGTNVSARIIKFNDERDQVELSRKALLPKPYLAYKQNHGVGDTVSGRVRSATKTHAYLDLGAGVTGVIFFRDLDNERVEDASIHSPVDTDITARIIKFNDERDQVGLSRKALLPQPFVGFKAAHSIGQSVSGIVRSTNKSFAYVDLAGGAQGIIHISQLSAYRVNLPSDVVTIGQAVQATIIKFNDESDQVDLSLRVPPTAPAPRLATTSWSARPSPSASAPSTVVPPAPPRSPQSTWSPRPTETPTAAPQTPQPRTVTAQGETVEEALDAACDQLRVSRNNISYEVIDHGERRRFLRRGRPAQVRVTTR